MDNFASKEVINFRLLDRAVSYVAISAAVIAVYDHFTTLESEIRLVWRRPKWGTVQILFFITRYVGLTLQIYTAWIYVNHISHDTTDVSKTFHSVASYLGGISLFAMQGIMMYRVSSMYVHNRMIIGIMVTALVLEISSVILILILDQVMDIHKPVYQPAGVELCKRDSFSILTIMNCIPILVFELLILGLVTVLGFKFFHAKNIMHTFTQPRRVKPRPSLLHILMRDSILFPFVIAMCALVNLIADLQHSYSIAQLVFIPSALFPVILGPRLILNLREAYYAPYEDEFKEASDEQKSSGTTYPRYPLRNSLSLARTESCKSVL